MAMFAFFFPLSLIMFAFRGAENVPSWMSGLGKGFGVEQIKKLINAIVSLAAAVITYTVIMVIIARFFTNANTSVSEIVNAITTGRIFEADLSADNIETLTITGVIALVYVISYITDKIPTVSKMILSAFNLQSENSLSEKLGNDMMQLTSSAFNSVKNAAKTVISGGEAKAGK
jgi:ABC-type proline/glycine betaine transport system permease subunit